MRVPGQHWSADLKAEVSRRLKVPGASATQVAREMGLRKCSVMGFARKLRFQQTKPEPAVSVEKPRVRVPYRTYPVAQEGDRISILHWCDNHHRPGADLEHVRWIARHIGENPGKFQMIRHGGDMCDYDSVSQHDPLGSVQAKHKPSLAADMEAHEECLSVFRQELGRSDIPMEADLGNHEWRVFIYEQLRGELEGSLWLRVKEMYAQYGWRAHDFGTLNKVGGVIFTHIPLSANRGRPYGSPQTIVRDLTCDLVACHTHKGGHWPSPKIGSDVTYYNGACSLPYGVVKDYCKLNPTGWRWGINEIIIQNGRITDFSFVSMLELQRRYA